MDDDGRVVPTGGVIGIVGGGQLGRMAALAAAALGYRCHVFCPAADEPAVDVAFAATIASYDDADAIEIFASAVDVITFEFENLPAASFRHMARHAPVRPHWRCLEMTQHRVTEKDFLNRQGCATAAYAALPGPGERLEATGSPAILKTARMGYDGKGQVRVTSQRDLEEAWAAMGGRDAGPGRRRRLHHGGLVHRRP